MNYYTDFRNGYYMNNKDECCNDYSKNNNNYYNFDNNYDNKRGCCVRKVEETFCCYPSYYNEEKKKDKKEEIQERCFEGTFRICPRKSYCDNKEDNKQDSCYKDDKKYENRNNKCCFCRLFSRW